MKALAFVSLQPHIIRVSMLIIHTDCTDQLRIWQYMHQIRESGENASQNRIGRCKSANFF